VSIFFRSLALVRMPPIPCASVTLRVRICRVLACFRVLEFESPEVRKRFVIQQQDVLLQVSIAWCIWLLASGLALMFSDQVNASFLGIYLAPAGIIVVTTVLSRYVPFCRYYNLHFLCFACLGIIVLAGASVHEVSKIVVEHAWQDTLKDVIQSLQNEPMLELQLHDFVVIQASREAFWQILVTIVLMLDVLKMTTFDWWARSIYLLPPIMVVVVSTVSPFATLDVPNVLTAYILISVYFFALGFGPPSSIELSSKALPAGHRRLSPRGGDGEGVTVQPGGPPGGGCADGRHAAGRHHA